MGSITAAHRRFRCVTSKPIVGFVMRAHLARTETFVHNQLIALERYHPVVLAHFRRPVTDAPLLDGAIGRDLLPDPLAGIDAGLYRATRLPLPATVSALARYARQRDVRLLHFHFLTDARHLLGLERRLRLPSIVSCYGWDVSLFPRLGRGLGHRYLKRVFQLYDLFLAMSEDMQADLLDLGCPSEKIRVHYYGSDTSRFRFPQRDYDAAGVLNVLLCGRLIEAKGQHHVLEALRTVQRRGGPEFRVTIVGEGPLRARLEAMTREYGWQERVIFAGHVPYASEELVEHFRAADVFAHPSFTLNGRKEGIPGTIVEAMACGLPVVATWHAGIPAVIDDRLDGLLVPERDIPALADALESLLSDASERRRIGTAAAQRAATQLDIRTGARALERIYDELI
jgi:glycosyltransferase involved in cell wall biosynthesis